MRMLLVILCVFLTTTLALGQVSSGQDKNAKTKEELRKFFLDYHEAASKRDRAALERLFADEYVWIQANGNINDKTKHINGILGNDANFQVLNPSFDQLLVYGEMAINRTAGAGISTTAFFAKKDGRWQFVQVQGTRLPPERKPIELDPKTLDSFVGKYEFAPDAVGTVTREGNTLMWKGGRRPKAKLMPLSDTRFFVENTDAEMTFYKDAKGQITHLDFRLGNCQDSKARKIE